MSEIILYWWVMTAVGVMAPVEIEGWKSMKECEIAAESLTINLPKSEMGVIATCGWVPK